MPGMPVSTRAPAPASGPVIKSSTAPIPAGHGYLNPATNNKPRAGITRPGSLTSGRLAGESTTATKPGAAKTRHAAGVAMRKAATFILFVLMLAGLLAAMLAYFDVLMP